MLNVIYCNSPVFSIFFYTFNSYRCLFSLIILYSLYYHLSFLISHYHLLRRFIPSSLYNTIVVFFFLFIWNVFHILAFTADNSLMQISIFSLASGQFLHTFVIRYSKTFQNPSILAVFGFLQPKRLCFVCAYQRIISVALCGFPFPGALRLFRSY